LCDDISEKEILECLVLIVRWRLFSIGKAGIDLIGRRAFDFVEPERSQVRDLEFLGDRAALLVALQRGRDDQAKVVVQRVRQRFQSGFVKILFADSVFKRKERFAVRVLSGQMSVVERKYQGIDISDPSETRR